MNPVVLTVDVGDDRRLVIELPQEIPSGKVEVTLKPASSAADLGASLTLTRDEARAMLMAAGALSTPSVFPDGVTILDDDLPVELPPDSPSIDSIIDEDRGMA